ncbi:NTP transferase domain-containing protein [Solihabitans fulvus]|uniref:NTP transferase domain-containing protein n=1 Tax=Solihabitans fulvus TaxID=1892852 RepID=A0A5B2WQR3_9PSEU|nr:NTP transferase domain-containing protein [Solihabitans fulvus]KAA2253002.1 NTP transferase domain-containing protein [Solihabitans fulvus]
MRREPTAAVVLAGGRASRLAGIDKAAVELHGRTLLSRALAAAAGADHVVVVGPRRQLTDGPEPLWTREEPPGAGPVAGLAAGLAALPADVGLVTLLAVDQPMVTDRTVARLVAALAGEPGAAGALLVDDAGRAQWLAGVWRADRLRAALSEDPAGRSLRAVLGPLEPLRVPALPGETDDVDTPDDLDRLRRVPETPP